MTWPPAAMPSELGDLADDVRRLFRDIERDAGRPATAGQCTPTLDVLETDESVELVLDLPGVPPERVRILLKGDVVVIAGEKDAGHPDEPAGTGAFHLVERGFGRFARAVRLSTPFDGGRAKASLADGELRIVLPRIHDRRGQARLLPVGREALPGAGTCS